MVARVGTERHRREFLVLEHRDPLAAGQVRGQDDGASLVRVGQQVEEQLALVLVEQHEAELVDDQQVDLLIPLLKPTEHALVTRLVELAHQIRGRAKMMLTSEKAI